MEVLMIKGSKDTPFVEELNLRFTKRYLSDPWDLRNNSYICNYAVANQERQQKYSNITYECIDFV